MFRSISENPHRNAGKRTDEKTTKMITTQYKIGRDEWQPQWQGSAHVQFQKVRYTRIEGECSQ